MKLYDAIISKIVALTISSKLTPLSFQGQTWDDAGKDQLIFKDDTAYELGGSSLPGYSGVLLTGGDEFVNEDEAVLIGEDLPNIKGDTPYARLVFVKVNDDKLGVDNALYQNIRKIEYTRYHVSPEGYMMRISTINRKESVRVSKSALKRHLDFAKVARLLIDGYHKVEAVEAVKIIFITDPSFPYEELSGCLTSSENITTALDHLLNKVKMDCHSCALQVVCNEVEAMVEEDFKK